MFCLSCVLVSVLLSPPIKGARSGDVGPVAIRSSVSETRISRLLEEPKLPFYVTLAPGDTLVQGGTSIVATTYTGELTMNDGDSVTTGKDSSGPTILHIGNGHVVTLLPNTVISAKVRDTDSNPGVKSMDSNLDYLFLSKGGLLGSSGRHGGRASNEDLLASLDPVQTGGGPIIIKTVGSTTGVKGSTFLLRLVGDSVVVNLFDCESAHIVNSDGNTYDNDGSVKDEVTVPKSGTIKHK